MTLIRNLVLVLCLGLLFLKLSNAQTVTVPLENGLSITVSTGTNTAALQNLYTNPSAVDVTMPDDSNVNVPLSFSFPFYGQTFNNSWMYSNGAVSFTGGNAPGGFCCSGLDLTTLRDTRYNYSIMPLWTDLIAQSGKHYKLSTPTSTTYGWYNVNEYGSNARSSFELTIDSGGGINTVFAGAVVTGHQVTSGMIGDISKNEYYQNYYGQGINSGAFSWSLGGAPVYDPCKDNPLSSPTCAGFSAALANIAPTSSITTVESVSQPVTETTASAPPTTTAAAVAEPVSVVATTVAASTQAQQSKPGVSLSQILRIVGNEQNRISTLEKSVVQAANDQATKLSEQSKAVAETVAATAVTNSLASQTQFSAGGVSLINKIVQQEAAALTNSSTISATSGLISANSSKFNTSSEQETSPQESINFGTRSVITDYINDSNLKLSSMQETVQTSSQIRVSESNSLATGITIANISIIPIGYSAYNTQLTDSKFYDPKEIYKGQQTVDNIRVLRGLGSDIKHQQMIQSQYR